MMTLIQDGQLKSQLQKAIEEHRRMTYRQLVELLNIPVSTSHRIINEHLQVCQLCTLWVPHSLSEEQQQCRVNWCRQTLKKFRSGLSKKVNSIITGDKAWIYYYNVPKKSQSKIWVFEGNSTQHKQENPGLLERE